VRSEHHAAPEERLALVAADDDRLVAEPPLRAVPGEQPVFGVERPARPVGLAVFGQHPLAVIVVHAGDPQLGVAAPLVDGVAEHLLDLGLV
jgi:hypothetical protein